mmetsp:Transcript_134724/g.430453  ORF Transcript_134724/g.430453 Transcript_134724/m.430453 type:complete len:257 (+) Transcript_134724:2222-2992(+)
MGLDVLVVLAGVGEGLCELSDDLVRGRLVRRADGVLADQGYAGALPDLGVVPGAIRAGPDLLTRDNQLLEQHVPPEIVNVGPSQGGQITDPLLGGQQQSPASLADALDHGDRMPEIASMKDRQRKPHMTEMAHAILVFLPASGAEIALRAAAHVPVQRTEGHRLFGRGVIHRRVEHLQLAISGNLVGAQGRKVHGRDLPVVEALLNHGLHCSANRRLHGKRRGRRSCGGTPVHRHGDGGYLCMACSKCTPQRPAAM